MDSQGSCVNIPNNGAGPADPRNDIHESDDPFTFPEVPFGYRARKSSSESGSDDSTVTDAVSTGPTNSNTCSPDGEDPPTPKWNNTKSHADIFLEKRRILC